MGLSQKSLGTAKQSAVARLFSAGVIQEMARKGRSPSFSRLIVESGIASMVTNGEPVRNLYETAFALLRTKDYRHEYVYKAAIAQKILTGKHSIRTAVMLTEFRVGNCKADVAILNGTSTVYEIKSERDNLDRLESQIAAYRKMFAKVYVLTGEAHSNSVLESLPEDVGVLLLTDRYNISTLRDAIESPDRVVPEAILYSLRLHEAVKILELMGICVPNVPNTQLHRVVRERFIDLDPETVHACMVRVLRETRSHGSLSDLLASLPRSIHAAVLSTQLRVRDHVGLTSAMNTSVREALTWV